MSLKSPEQRRLLLAVLVIVAIQFVGWQIGGFYTWGVGLWHGLPLWAIFLAALLTLGSFFLPETAGRAINRCLDGIASSRKRHSKPSSILHTGIAFLAVVALLYLLRSRSLLYGDGYAAVANTLRPWNSLFQSVHEWLKPLSIAFFKLSYDVQHSLFDATPESSFAFASALGGAVAWFGLFRLSQVLTDSPAKRLLLFVSAMTSGAVMLFVGHIEFYVWGGATLLWLLALVHDSPQKRSLAVHILVGLVAVLFNVMLLPAVVAILAISLSERFPVSWRRLFKPTPILIFAALSSVSLAFVLQWSQLSYGTVPLVPYERNPYWLLSAEHLSDIANALLFASPLIVILFLPRRFRSAVRTYPMLFVSACLLWLVTVWIDPDGSAARDWDLLSQYGIPLTLLCAIALLHDSPAQSAGRLIVPLLLLALCLNLPILYEKLSRDRMVDRLNSIVEQDPHYQTSYLAGIRAVSWSAILYNEEGRHDIAERFLRRRIAADPTSAMAYANLGAIYYEAGQYDSAEVYLTAATTRDSTDLVSRTRLLNAQLFQQKWEALAPDLLRAPMQDSVAFSALHQTGKELFSQGKLDLAVQCFHRLDSLRPGSIYYKLSLAMSYARLGQRQSALQYFRQADSLCLPTQLCQLYAVSIKDLTNFRCPELARELIPRYREVCTSVDTVLINAARKN